MSYYTKEILSFMAFDFQTLQVGNECWSFLIKNYSEEFKLIGNKNFCPVYIDCRDIVNALSFTFGNPETIYACPLTDFLNELLQLMLYRVYVFESGSNTEVVNIGVIINTRIATQ